MDVRAWLQELGLGQYADAFEANAVDGGVLAHLTAGDLKELGVKAVGHRRRLLDAIVALQAGPRDSRSETAGERRQVTVLFADLAGYTTLSHELDPEDVHGLLERFFEHADRAVEEHGGRVDKHLGDCVMAVFGAPVARGNDAEQALRAALAIRAAMPAISAEVGRPVDVHVGVAGGQVVASDTGSGSHRTYTVTGQSVNLASRLTDVARAGEILVADAIRRSLGERLQCDALPSLEVKGFAEPVRAWRVAGLRAPPRHAPLVGRAREVDRFRTALGSCRMHGRGAAIHVRGEAGIGKTRLVEAFQEEARGAGFACHAGLVLDFGSGTGQAAIRALVRGLLGLDEGNAEPPADAAAVDDAAFLNDLLGLPQPADLRAFYDALDNPARARGRRRALAQLTERASRSCPRLLVLEDLHWADRPTLEHLAALAGTVGRCPTILVTTSRIEGDPLLRERPTWPGGAEPEIVQLGPLDPSEALVIARELRATSAALAERCVERAAGNPLFLEQLLRHAEEGPELAVPSSVQSLVQARLDHLAPAERGAIQAASALGQRFDLAALRHLLGQPGYDPDGLVAQGLVRPEGEGFLFAHALVRDAVYDSLLKSRRCRLHRLAAAWYEGRDAALVAQHLDRADDPEAARAYLLAARGQAADYRYELALGLVERGLERAAAPADRTALACLQGEILHDLGQMPAAGRAYAAALAAASADAERCRALIGLAAVKRVTDDLEGAFADLEQAGRAAEAADLRAEAARIHFLRGNLHFPRGDLEGCRREHRRSLALAREAGAAEQAAAALGGLGDAEYVRGRMLSAHQAFRACVALCSQRGFGRIEVANRPMLAFTQWFAGETSAALAKVGEAIAMAARVGHHRAQMIAHHAGYFCCHSLADRSGAWGHAERALELARQLGARRFEAEALAFMAELHRLDGRRVKAVAHAERAVAVSRETGMAFLGPLTLGVLALATDELSVCEAALAEGKALLSAEAVSHNHYLFRREAIDACLGRSWWDRAESHAAALAAYAAREPCPWTDFTIARAHALAAWGRGERGAHLLGELVRLQAEGRRFGYLDALPAIEAALAGSAVPDASA